MLHIVKVFIDYCSSDREEEIVVYSGINRIKAHVIYTDILQNKEQYERLFGGMSQVSINCQINSYPIEYVHEYFQ